MDNYYEFDDDDNTEGRFEMCNKRVGKKLQFFKAVILCKNFTRELGHDHIHPCFHNDIPLIPHTPHKPQTYAHTFYSLKFEKEVS